MERKSETVRASEWQPLHHKSHHFWQNFTTLAFRRRVLEARAANAVSRNLFLWRILVSHCHSTRSTIVCSVQLHCWNWSFKVPMTQLVKCLLVTCWSMDVTLGGRAALLADCSWTPSEHGQTGTETASETNWGQFNDRESATLRGGVFEGLWLPAPWGVTKLTAVTG